MYEEFFAKALELQRLGRPFATATVVRVENPTSGKPGDKAIVTLDGELFGWIGGSCARPTVVEEARAALKDDRSRLVRLSSEPDAKQQRAGLTDLSMTCFSGGTMEIYIEPHQPQPRLLIVGELPVAQALARLAGVMSFAVGGVRLEGEPQLEGATETIDSLEALRDSITPLTYVVVASHGDQDELAVESALRGRAPYVGLVASPRRSESIRKYLTVVGLGEKDQRPLHAPAGLDIQARRPDEIALSILAEIIQIRRNMPQLDWDTAAAENDRRSGDSPSHDGPDTAIDPICGMSVQISGAQHVFEHQGSTYYFCCGGCRTTFASDPAAALSKAKTG